MDGRSTRMRGHPFPLAGPELYAGDPAPDFLLQQRGSDGLRDITLEQYSGKTLVLSVAMSLDTPICETQARRFNDEAAILPANVEVVMVTMDLPFAQARFCSDKGLYQITAVSDHRTGAFGEAYGVLIRPLRLFSRAIFVVGPDGVLKHVQYVPEVTQEPNYEPAFIAARETQD